MAAGSGQPYLLPALAAEQRASACEVCDGVWVLHGVLNPDECARWVAASEAAGYDNATHPDYQNARLDRKEERTRRNDRCVVKVAPEEEEALWDRIKHACPAAIDAEEYGTWGRWGVNDMWRFYRYQGNGAELFPVHRDNATVKKYTFMSWFTVLVYLTDGFEGGETNFHPDPFSPPAARVTPAAGSVVLFYHTGKRSPWHSGAPVDGGAKYVLRTDVMYMADEEPYQCVPKSAPYDDSDNEYELPR
eukprot:TRINITY_DN11830_c0_g1_i1.p1 TRINITY_DN11830_c0_g1~~TRINITY_DN11830_c0_g1_i1.p1  ORF type:complete len:247 (+),score=65.23 TRINITY_DN11830_c0_g1_i1:77-817(+)